MFKKRIKWKDKTLEEKLDSLHRSMRWFIIYVVANVILKELEVFGIIQW